MCNRKLFPPSKFVFRARELRSKETDAEKFLWHKLRAKRYQNYKFRRQQPIGPYIVDFFCPSKRIAIELDGGGHAEDEQILYDAQRTHYLEASGIQVLRFWNNQIFQNTRSVLEAIYQELIIR
jgi:very-short-patch-repair endonuclease